MLSVVVSILQTAGFEFNELKISETKIPPPIKRENHGL